MQEMRILEGPIVDKAPLPLGRMTVIQDWIRTSGSGHGLQKKWNLWPSPWGTLKSVGSCPFFLAWLT
jgi:hypothetical protein